MEKELSPCLQTHVHTSLHVRIYSLTHSLRQLSVSSPLCHIKDAATLWASDDTQIQTRCTQLSLTERVGWCVHAFLHIACVNVYQAACELVCVGVCLLCL